MRPKWLALLIYIFLCPILHAEEVLSEPVISPQKISPNWDILSVESAWEIEMPLGNRLAPGESLLVQVVQKVDDSSQRFEVAWGKSELFPMEQVSPNLWEARLPIPIDAVLQNYSATIRSYSPKNQKREEKNFEYMLSQRIAKIRFSGLEHSSEQELKELMLTKEGQLPNSIRLMADEDRLKSQGKFNDLHFKINEIDSGRLELVIEVKENPILDEIEFVGLSAFSKDQLLKIIKSKVGQQFSYQDFRDDLELIRSHYNDAQYFLFKILDYQTPSPNQKPAKLVFNLEEGHLGQILLSGNDKTKDQTILRELSLKQGDLLRSDLVKDDIRRIYNLNFFESVEPNIEPSATLAGEYDLALHVKEKRTSTISLGIGSSQLTGVYGSIDLNIENLWGEGKSLLFRSNFGGQFTTFQIRYTDPWALGYRTSLSTAIWETQQVNYITADKEQRTGVSVSVGKPLALYWRASVSFLAENVQISAQGQRKINGVAVTNNSQPYQKRVLGFDLSYDTRDFYANPHSGELHSIGISKAFQFIDGTLDYWMLSAQANWFYPITLGQTFATRIMTDYATGQFPESDEFFVGSDRTVRGYSYPFSQGRRRYLMNLEYRLDINETVQGVAFVDIGAAFDSVAPSGIAYSSSGFRMGKGVGARVNTPVGPIRLDLGWGDGYNGDYGPALHFSIGQAF